VRPRGLRRLAAPLLAWALVAALAAGLAARVGASRARGPGFATLPILTPTSLPYEAAMRADRAQPAGQGGAEALDLAEALLAQGVTDPALAAQVEALASDRATLLALRNQRHALNIRLMDVGVEVAGRLTAPQWEAIHMRRDTLRAQAEAAVFARLLQRLRGEQVPPTSPAPPALPAPP
jgi:hypothetical protein